jgi:hypothetical protein
MPRHVPAIFFILLLFSCCNLYSAEKADSSRTRLKAECTLSFNSNGIASIPAFSLGKPALVASVGLAKWRLSFDPTLAYGLDMRPWYIDSWIHLKIVDKPRFLLRTGINFSNFFETYKPPEGVVLPYKITQSSRYWAIELATVYYFTPASSITLMYWNDRGQDPGTLIGHYISITGDRSEIPLGSHIMLSANVMLFYINYTGENDGLFVSPRLSVSIRNPRLSLFFQANQAISTNIEPFPGFNWNVGLAYTL